MAIQDLSHLAAGSLGTKAGSMAATNTISTTPAYGAPGSVSEGSDDLGAYGKPTEVDPVGPVSGDGEGPADEHLDRGFDRGQRAWNPGPPAWKTTSGQ